MKRLPSAAVLLLAALVAAGCVRLGLWQLSRLHEKQRLNQELRAALQMPPRDLQAADAAAELGVGTLRRGRVTARGHYDESMHRSYAGQWFAFAAIALIGSIALVLRGRAKPAPEADRG